MKTMKRRFAYGVVVLMAVAAAGRLAAGSVRPSDPGSSAAQAFGVLQKNCAACHGEGGVASAFMPLNRAAMVRQGAVIPGRPEESPLYRRITGAVQPAMPEGGPRLPAYDIAKIRQWIDDGAPQWTPDSSPARRFISNEEVVAAIEQDLAGLEMQSRRFQRYFVLTNLHNSPGADLETYRVALFKLINSLSWEKEILLPAVVDADRTLIRMDLRDFEWSDETWKTITSGYPYAVRLPTAAYSRIQRLAASDTPFIRADWFLATASLPPLYHEVLELPATERELESCGPAVRRCLRIDTARNLREAAGVRVARAGFAESGVSNNNRIVERHRSSYGAYWKSYDFSDNVGRHNIFQHPVDFERAGGEIIFNLPNGLQAYLLVNQRGERIDQAPTNIVFNKGAGRPEIRNGQSCMTCHVNGVRPLTDEVGASAVPFAPELRSIVSALYAPSDAMDALLAADQRRFEHAVLQTGARTGEEPLAELAQRYRASVSAAAAAAETGFTENEFLSELAANPRLQQLGLTPLVSGGAVKRDVWEEEFGEIVEALGIGVWANPTRVFGERFFVAPAPRSGRPGRPPATINAPAVPPGFAFVRLEPGVFQMGCSAGDIQCDSDERAAHTVRLTRPIEMGVHEVTGAEWQAVMGSNPSAFNGDRRPVENVSWNDVREFLNRLNSRDDGFCYRLPTEAEWEYAARAGSVEPLPGGPGTIAEFAWFAENSSAETHPVGEKRPNAWGLYDMEGNVAEWVQDTYAGSYAPSTVTDPAGPGGAAGSKVIRGGSWNDDPKNLRVSRRDALNPSRRYSSIGFRLVREPRVR
ncbi:MAG TPA: SUMF1/EgtB/PvdO family nonheme iron enzyme [Terriglobia bacterium]|nr:SUMF1/EgtB/PvdO family nonheme iron enzyme [Terriglobia bacterium]